MGFLDKAKAAANDLAAKADTALANSGISTPGASGGQPDKLLRDLGVLTWLQLTNRPEPEGERDRILAALRDAEQRGALGPLTMQSAPPPPAPVPPPPGAAGAAHTPPPPPHAASTSSPAAQADGPTSTATSGPPMTQTPPPPPPPSWAKPDES